MTTKLYFPSSWGMSQDTLTDLYRKQIGPFDVELVNNPLEAEYVIQQDHSDEKVPNESKVIFFQREPDHVAQYKPNHPNTVATYYHSRGQYWLPQTWWLGYTYNELSALKCPPKTNSVSVVESGRNALPGHGFRRSIIDRLITHVPELHVYGTVCNQMKGDQFKGVLPFRQKEDAFLNYQYAIVIENGSVPGYFSEKFIDAILCWTIPIYWGCSNINEFFPKECYFNLDPFYCTTQVPSIIRQDLKAETFIALQYARDLILNKYNLIPTVQRAIENYENSSKHL